MFIAVVVLTMVLAALLLLSARGKLVHDPMQMAILTKVGFPENRAPLLAAAEAAAAIGLLVGLYWWPIGDAAAIGIMAYFVGAVGSHLRVRDRNVVAPLALLFAGLADLWLRHASR